ncbi:MAG: DUF1549 domain-containing protein [Roseibacillus sp.]
MNSLDQRQQRPTSKRQLVHPHGRNDQLVASGFNRLHLIIDRGTALPEDSFFKNVVDRVTAVGTTFMGMTVHCATCHDHKYDPLTQKDFYSLFAFFNNIDAAPETGGRPKNGLQPPFVKLGTPGQKLKLKSVNEQLAKLEPEVNLAKKTATEERIRKRKSHSCRPRGSWLPRKTISTGSAPNSTRRCRRQW